METTTISNIPQWAVSYIEYGDIGDTTPAERDMVDRYRRGLADEGIRLAAPIEGTENEYCAYPAFGAACATIDYTATIASWAL